MAPIRKFHYIPDRRHTKIERAFIPPFDALDHLLSRRDYPVNLTQPTITIYHDSKKRQTDSQVERKFKMFWYLHIWGEILKIEKLKNDALSRLIWKSFLTFD